MSEWNYSNIPDLTGKKIIITGGNSGLGFETAKQWKKSAELTGVEFKVK